MQAPRTKATVGKNQGYECRTSASGLGGRRPWPSSSRERPQRPPSSSAPCAGSGTPVQISSAFAPWCTSMPIAVRVPQAEGAGLLEEPGQRWVVDHVVDGARPARERARSTGAGSSGMQSDARRVDHDGARRGPDGQPRGRPRGCPGQGRRCGSRASRLLRDRLTIQREAQREPQAFDRGPAGRAARPEQDDGGAAQVACPGPRGCPRPVRSRPCCSRASPCRHWRAC